MPLVIFLILWILSPLVLIPMCIHFHGKYKSIYNENVKNINRSRSLENLIQSLISRDALTDDEKDTYYSHDIHTNISMDTKQSYKEYSSNNVSVDNTNNTVDVPIRTSSNDKSFQDVPQPKPSAIATEVHAKKDIAYTNTAPKRTSKISTISVILIVGVIFVLLSGIVFTTTAWNSLNNIIRSTLIFSASILFFGVGTFAEKKLNLSKTGMAFFSIGCFLLPIDILAIGIFQLFGSWLSWNGDGKYLLCAIGCILISIASYIGTKRYSSKFYAGASLFGASATIGLLLKSSMLLIAESSIFIILIALYLFLLLMLKDKFKNYLISLQDTYSTVWDIFIAINVIVLGLISLITAHYGTISGIAVILMGLVFMAYANQKDMCFPNIIYIVLSLITITLGLFLIFKLDNLIVMCMALILFITIVQELNFLETSIKKFYMVILYIVSILGILIISWNLFTMNISKILTIVSIVERNYIISIIVCIACTTWVYLRKDVKFMLLIQSMYVVLLAWSVSLMINNVDYEISLISAIMLIVYCIYGFVPKLNNQGVYINYSIVTGLLILLKFDYIPVIVWLIVISINVFKDDTLISKISRYVLPLALILLIYKIYPTFMITFIILLTISIILNFKNIKSLRDIFTVYMYVLTYMHYPQLYDNYMINISIISLLTLFSVFKVIISKKSDLHSKKVFYTNVSIINLILTSLSFMSLDISLIIISFALSSILFVIYYVLKHFQSDTDILTILKYYTLVILEVSQWYICLSDHHFAISLVIILMNFIFGYSFKNNILTLFSIINLYYVTNDLVSTEIILLDYSITKLIFNIIFFMLSGIIGRYLHKEFITADKDTKKLYIDYFTIFAIFPIIKIFLQYTNLFGLHLNIFIGFILLSIYPLFYYNRILFTHSKQILLSISSTMLCFVFWNEPFLNISDTIIAEWNCIPIIALSLILCIIWKDYSKVREYSPFVAIYIVTSVLSIYEVIYNQTTELISLILLLIVDIILSKKLLTKKWKFISLTTFSTILWIQPIIDIPNIFLLEWNCLPLIILSIGIGLIWKEYPKLLEYLPFYTTLGISIILSISAIISQELTDAFILLIALIFILIVSFMIKRKKWFSFSTIELIILTIYLTKNFWLSIAWWIYLLIVGLLMISIGATNEYLKMKNENLKDNLKYSTKRLFQDWTW